MAEVVALQHADYAVELKNHIGGTWVATGKLFDTIDPTTGRVTGAVHEAGRAEVDAAVAAAKAALKGAWGSMSQEARRKLLHAVADRMVERHADFLEAEIGDTGMPLHFADHVNVPRGAANFKIFADLFANVPTESFTMDTPDGKTALNYGLRVPRGVIAVISPWNLPLLLTTWKVGPALACGNTVIVKPSEETPRSANLLAEVMAEVGVPDGVFNVLHGFGSDSTGQWLTEHPDVNGITFTGETVTGEAIMRAAAKGVRPVSFEMGGKNSAVLFADANLDEAIAGLIPNWHSLRDALAKASCPKRTGIGLQTNTSSGRGTELPMPEKPNGRRSGN